MTKILLVEDDKSLREIYGVRLFAEGYDIVSADDGEAALAMAIKERPDLIVSDVMMPKISGFEMLDLLKSNESTKNIKVIMMTALSSEQQRQRGEALGADRYLVKSQVGIEDVVRTIHEVLGDQGTAPAPAAPAPGQSPVNPPQATQPTSFANPQTAVAPTPDPVAPTPAPPMAVPMAEPAMPPPPAPVSAQAPPIQPPASAPTPDPMTAPVVPPPQQPEPQNPPASADEQPDQSEPKSNLTQSGSSMKSHKIEPTGETLTPKIDIDALLAKEEAKESGVSLPSELTGDKPSEQTSSDTTDTEPSPPLESGPIQTSQEHMPGVQISPDGTITTEQPEPAPTAPTADTAALPQPGFQEPAPSQIPPPTDDQPVESFLPPELTANNDAQVNTATPNETPTPDNPMLQQQPPTPPAA